MQTSGNELRAADKLPIGQSFSVDVRVWMQRKKKKEQKVICPENRNGHGFHTDRLAANKAYCEGAISILASIIIAVMGAALLRVSRLSFKLNGVPSSTGPSRKSMSAQA
ncbi:MAG: hypothetical protein LQ346_004467 [Caloplaca aetnensis]|nr:MAG: hypothetical protein LQ346_004467 [Caloplaca aetnensis]